MNKSKALKVKHSQNDRDVFLWVNGKTIESYLLKQHIFHSSKLIKNFLKYVYCCLEQYNTLWDSSNSVQYKTGISMVSDRDSYSDSKIPRHVTCNIRYVTKCHQDFLVCTWLKLVFSRSHCCISHAVFFSLIGECLWILMLALSVLFLCWLRGPKLYL